MNELGCYEEVVACMRKIRIFAVFRFELLHFESRKTLLEPYPTPRKFFVLIEFH